MKFALPASSRRRYLTGMDWSIGMLDAQTRWFTGVGNLSQIVLHLSGRLDVEALRSTLRTVSHSIPLIHGRVRRDRLNLCPYWAVPKTSDYARISVNVADLSPDQSDRAWQLLHAHVNTPIAGASTSGYLSFLLVRVGDVESRLGMVFDHRLLDAAGAELFIELLNQTHQGHLPRIIPRIRQTEPARLDCWGRQFSAGKKINAFRLQMSQHDVAALPLPSRDRRRPYRFIVSDIPESAVNRLSENAASESGAPLLLPSIIARAAASFAPLFRDSPLTGQQQMIMVAINRRPNDAPWDQLFFNHLSFLAFSVPTEQADDIPAAAKIVGRQFLQQIRDDIPGRLVDASLLTRICPHAIGRRLAVVPLKGRLCSFYLAVLPQSHITSPTFLDRPIINLIHTPRVPPPPGVGLCLGRFADHWNLTLSWLDGVFDASAAAQLMRRFRTALTGESFI